MPENQENCRASSVLFKAAIRSLFDPKPRRSITVKVEAVEETRDMLLPIRRVTINMASSGINSALREIIETDEKFSLPTCPQLLTEISSPPSFNASIQSYETSPNQVSPSSSGYVSSSSLENSFKSPSVNLTPRTSFAHPEFQNIKYVEPEKSLKTSDNVFLPPAKTCPQSYSTQRLSCKSVRDKETTIKSSVPLRPVHSLFSFSEGSYFDSHCHIDFLLNKAGFNGSFSEYQIENQNEFPPNYDGCIAVFCNPYSFKRVSIWEKHLEGNVWASFGCHPKNAASYDDLIEEDLIHALNHPKVRALGEIGLDYSDRSYCPEEKQKEVFRRQLRIAKGRNLPVVIHCREAYDDCLEILQEILPKDYLIHLHCFADKWSIAKKYMNEFSNLFIGITNLVTFASATDVHEVAQKIPLHRLLLETDAPYFVPTALSKQVKIAHPGMAIFVAEKIASLKNETLSTVVIYSRYNTKWVYGV